MATTLAKSVLITIFYVILIRQKLINGEQQVPCAFFFGDSLFDNGNNNLLPTLAKSNFPPYGIDYPDVPLGRFCNGRTIPDFITEFLGFEDPIPPLATATDSEILKGVNYASGGAGIRDLTGTPLGARTSMNGQLLDHKITICRIAKLLKYSTTSTTVDEYLNKCLYVVNMGNNDYLNNYLLSQTYPIDLFFNLDQFAQDLIQQYSQQLTILYKYGARKVVVFGLGPLGCIPQQLATIDNNNSVENKSISCVEDFNNAVHLFNNKLPSLVDNLNIQLPGAQFICVNVSSTSFADFSALGFKVTNAPCCVISPITGLCDDDKVLCSNRNEYAFWDNYHPTEAVNRIVATRIYNATSPSDAYPVDIRRLVQQ